MKIKKIGGDSAVSEVIGTVLLLMVAVIIFSSLIVYVLSSTDRNPSSPAVHMVGYMDETQHTIIEHRGGDNTELEDLKLIVLKGAEESYSIYFTQSGSPVDGQGEENTAIIFRDLNSNARWDVGDYIDINCTGLFGEITYWQISVVIIDEPSNSIIMSGIVKQGIKNLSPPVALFTYAPLDPKIDETIEFNASQSYDPDGGPLVLYKWDFEDDGITDAYGMIAVHQYTSSGLYTITLTVVDDEGKEGKASTGQYVEGMYIPPPPNVTENELPIVNFSWSVDPEVDGTINFLSNVSDPDGEITSFYWDFGDGNTSSSDNPSHTYAQSGNYTVTLVVTDDNGGQNSTEITITVPNILPIAGFSYSPANITSSRTAYFDGGSPYSFDKDGSIINWTWDFDNDSIIDAYGSTVSHLFSLPGNYTIVLNVTDNEGDYDIEIKNIRVYSPGVADSPRFLIVDNTPTNSPPGIWPSGIDNIIGACQDIMPTSDFSYGRAIDQWAFTDDEYTSPDLRGVNITDTVINQFDIVIWSTGDFPGDGGDASYDGNANTWSTSMTEGSDDTSNHVFEIYEHLTGNETAGTFLLCGTYAARDLQDYPGNGANSDEIWLGTELGLIEPTGGIHYDSDYIPFSGRVGSGSFSGEPYTSSGTLVGIANTSSGVTGIAMLNITSPIEMYELYKQANETFIYSLQASTEQMNVTVLDEDFDGASLSGWDTGGSYSPNEWHWDICAGGPGVAHSGSKCVGTDMEPSNYNYNAYANNWWRTPEMDLSGYVSATLEFYDWYRFDNYGDDVILEVYDGSWHTLYTFEDQQESWTHHSFDISSYTGGTIRIRWRMDMDSDSYVYHGYYLDDVIVTASGDTIPNGYYAIDADRDKNRSIILGFDLNADEITNESRTNYLRNALSWLAEGAGYISEIWVNNDPPEGWLDELNHVDTIQAGINAVTPGGTIYVNGTTGQIYEENVIVDKSVNIIGVDNPTIRASGTNVVKIQIDWATIDGFTIEGNSADNGIYLETAVRCTIINCAVSNLTDQGIYLLYSHNNTLQNNIIQGAAGAISASWSSGNKLINNTIFSNDEGGISLYTASLTNVVGNKIYDNGNSGGITLNSLERCIIFNNNIYNNSGNGIHLISSSNKNHIEKNTILNNSYGVSFEISNSNIILNNTILENRNDGIYIVDYSNANTIRENRVTLNVQGINLQNSSNNALLFNTIENNQYGIYFTASSNNVLDTNTITNNTNNGIQLRSSSNHNVFYSCSILNNSNGAYIETSEENIFQDNNISLNTLDGIYLYQSLASFPGENNITSNTISLNNRYGLYLYKSTGNVLSNNSIYSNAQDGIRCYTNTNENSITYNTIWNNSNGIYLFKGNYNIISYNAIHNNSAEGIILTSYSTENTIDNNTIDNNTNGIKFESSTVNNITENKIKVNHAKGILLSSSSGNDVYSNQIYSNIGDGIGLQSSDIITINKNSIWNNLHGIHLSSSGGTGNSILNNTIHSNTFHGIYLENSKVATAGNNAIRENKIYSNSEHGIYLYSSNINLLQENEIYSNSEHGISLNISDSNTLQENEIYSNNGQGIHLYLSDNIDIQNNNISHNSENGICILQSTLGDSFPLKNNLIWNNTIAGIYLNSSSSNYISYITFWNNSYGIVVDDSSSNNVVKYCIIRNNSYGLYMADSSTTNQIRDNNITGNNYGAYVATFDCTSNEIYNNNFINNTLHNDSQAYDLANNSWYIGGPGGGNYWNDKLPEETYYAIPPYGVQDKYPLESPRQWWL